MSRLGSQQPDATQRGVVVEKPKANIYTMLLILSLLAIIVGCICLGLEMKAYDWNFKAR
jgi:nicotinamide riboside transporter PnuC